MKKCYIEFSPLYVYSMNPITWFRPGRRSFKRLCEGIGPKLRKDDSCESIWLSNWVIYVCVVPGEDAGLEEADIVGESHQLVDVHVPQHRLHILQNQHENYVNYE